MAESFEMLPAAVPLGTWALPNYMRTREVGTLRTAQVGMMRVRLPLGCRVRRAVFFLFFLERRGRMTADDVDGGWRRGMCLL